MSHDHDHDPHPHGAKARHKALEKKNRFHQQLFYLMRLRRIDAERVKGIEDSLKSRPADREAEEVGDKVARIRNRLTSRQRISKERWNRFAGTSDGGGRGL